MVLSSLLFYFVVCYSLSSFVLHIFYSHKVTSGKIVILYYYTYLFIYFYICDSSIEILNYRYFVSVKAMYVFESVFISEASPVILIPQVFMNLGICQCYPSTYTSRILFSISHCSFYKV